MASPPASETAPLLRYVWNLEPTCPKGAADADPDGLLLDGEGYTGRVEFGIPIDVA